MSVCEAFSWLATDVGGPSLLWAMPSLAIQSRVVQERRLSKARGTGQWAVFLCGRHFRSCFQAPAWVPALWSLSDEPQSVNQISPFLARLVLIRVFTTAEKQTKTMTKENCPHFPFYYGCVDGYIILYLLKKMPSILRWELQYSVP